MLSNLILCVERMEMAFFVLLPVLCPVYGFMSEANRVLQASDGISQSPRGERPTEPTLGPSGIQERLNCWLKKRRTKILSHLRMVSSSYEDIPVLPCSSELKAFRARKKILSGLYPQRMKL